MYISELLKVSIDIIEKFGLWFILLWIHRGIAVGGIEMSIKDMQRRIAFQAIADNKINC
jgi:hypothetical protein